MPLGVPDAPGHLSRMDPPAVLQPSSIAQTVPIRYGHRTVQWEMVLQTSGAGDDVGRLLEKGRIRRDTRFPAWRRPLRREPAA